MLNPLIGVAFWIFLAVVVVAALWFAQARNKEKQKTIRLAIEKGVQLDPALVESLDKPAPSNPDGYYIGGYASLASGIGLIPFAYLLRNISVEAFYPLIGAGILAGLIGLSLIIVARMITRRADGRGL